MPKLDVSQETYEKIKNQLNEDNYIAYKHYKLIRTTSAGVFAGSLSVWNNKVVHLSHARRIYQWDGAATLSQLAMEGTSKPDKCKFPCEVDNIILTEAIEIIDVTYIAQKSIRGVKVWSA